MLPISTYQAILSKEVKSEPPFTSSITQLLADYNILYLSYEHIYVQNDLIPPLATACTTLVVQGTWTTPSTLYIKNQPCMPFLSEDQLNQSHINTFLLDYDYSQMSVPHGDPTNWSFSSCFAGSGSQWAAPIIELPTIYFDGVGEQFVPYTEEDHALLATQSAAVAPIIAETLSLEAMQETLTNRYLMNKHASGVLFSPPLTPHEYEFFTPHANEILADTFPCLPYTNGNKGIVDSGYYGFNCTVILDNYRAYAIFINTRLVHVNRAVPTTVTSANWEVDNYEWYSPENASIIRLPTMYGLCTETIKLAWEISVTWGGFQPSDISTHGSSVCKILIDIQEYSSHAKPRLTLDPDPLSHNIVYPAALDLPGPTDESNPTPVVANMIYPDYYPDIVAYLEATEIDDGLMHFISGHSFYVSSYNRWGHASRNLFDLDPATSWKTASVGSGPWYIDGHVRNPEGYTFDPYNISVNPSPYRGGGDFENMFDTLLNTGEWVSGEYFGVIVPFSSTLYYIDILPVTDFLGQCLGKAKVLGRQGGEDWQFLQEITVSSYTDGEYARVTITDTVRTFYEFRVVVTHLYDAAPVLQIANIRFCFDAWESPPSAIIPSLPGTLGTYSDTLRATDMEFPDSFTGMTAYMLATDLDDCVQIFSSGMTGQESWRDITKGYLIEVSSVTRITTTDSNADLFDGTASSFWSAGSTASMYPYYRRGVYQGIYTANPYGGAANAYSGGGTGFYHTTSYGGGSTVAGEWIELRTPFRMLVKSVQFKPRTDNRLRAPKGVVVLGRNGTTADWTLLATLTYDPYTNDVFQSKTVSTADKYNSIRLVITSTIGNATLTISEAKLVYDAYY